MRRFWDKVQKTDGCWLWTAARSQRGEGYGTFWFDGRLQHAHRVAWQLSVGPLDEGIELHHECREVRCVNPAHLRAVSVQEHKILHLRDRCAHGHEWSVENTYYRPDGRGRECRTCRRESFKAFRARQSVLSAEKELAR